MYKALIRTIPVEWLLEILNVGTIIFNFIASVFERVASFLSTNVWNLTGLDTYYVFIDENPIPIHYPKFLIGGVYDKVWFYNVRTREFSYGLNDDIRVEYLPALTATYRALTDDGEFTSFDITDHINRITFRTHPGIFPTPMQLVGAWSLHSGIWPSMMQTKYKHVITMMNGTTAEDLDVDVGLKATSFNWLTFSEEEEVADEETDDGDDEQQSEVDETEEEDENTDDLEQSETDEETVIDSAADVEEMVEESKATVEEMKEAVEAMENKANDIREEGKKLIQAIFEEMNKSCTEATEETVKETKETVEEELVIDKQVLDKIKEELNYKYSIQATEEETDMHIINQKEYFENVD